MPPEDPPVPTHAEAIQEAQAVLAGAMSEVLLPLAAASGVLWLAPAEQQIVTTGIQEGPFSIGSQPSAYSFNEMHADIQDGKKRIANLENQVLGLQRLIEGIIRRVGIDRFAEIVKDIEYDITPDSK